MDRQRLAIEEVRGAADNLQLVDERPCCLFRFEVDGEDGTRQGTELRLREFVEGIILQAGIVHAFDLGQSLTLPGEPQGGLCLPTQLHPRPNDFGLFRTEVPLKCTPKVRHKAFRGTL